MTVASIGPITLRSFADAGVDGETAPILAFRGIATDARALSFADIRTKIPCITQTKAEALAELETLPSVTYEWIEERLAALPG